MKANVYVDGFNFYYRCLKGTPYRWLDLGALARQLAPKHTIRHIRYFTARVVPRPNDPEQPQRQQAYLRALQTLPNLSIHFGTFLSHPKTLPLANGGGMATIIKTEEKGSDVNFATHLLLDAFREDFDIAIVITNDSDLELPVRTVRDEFKRPVFVYGPKRQSSELRRAASGSHEIRAVWLAQSQFPASVRDSHGTIHKPQGW